MLNNLIISATSRCQRRANFWMYRNTRHYFNIELSTKINLTNNERCLICVYQNSITTRFKILPLDSDPFKVLNVFSENNSKFIVKTCP